MGGTVNVFIRDKNRQLHKMHRWTNTLPSFLDMIGHRNEDDHLDGYLTPWLEMKDDWDQNKKTSQFIYNMTDMYFPSPSRICKSEYGLVFIDYITKTILSYQDYTSVCQISYAATQVSLDQDEIKLLREIAEKGKLWYGSLYNREDPTPIRDKRHLSLLIELKNTDLVFYVDNSPWTVIDGNPRDISTKEINDKIQKILNQ